MAVKAIFLRSTENRHGLSVLNRPEEFRLSNVSVYGTD